MSASQRTNDWHYDLFDIKPAPLCANAYFCPCLTYGKTQWLRENPEEDPSNYKLCNQHCGFWCLLGEFTPFQCIFQCINRGDVREQYNIKGDNKKDFLTSWCCSCCALIQERKEVEYQNGKGAGFGNNRQQGYQTTKQMEYPSTTDTTTANTAPGSREK